MRLFSGSQLVCRGGGAHHVMMQWNLPSLFCSPGRQEKLQRKHLACQGDGSLLLTYWQKQINPNTAMMLMMSSVPAPCTGTQAGSANLWVKHACVGIPHSDFVSSDQIGLMCVGESCWAYYRQENLNKLYYVSVFFFFFLHSHFSDCRHRAAASAGPCYYFIFFYQIKF